MKYSTKPKVTRKTSYQLLNIYNAIQSMKEKDFAILMKTKFETKRN